MTVLYSMIIAPAGGGRWAPPCDLQYAVSLSGQRISDLRAINEGPGVGQVQLVRDDNGDLSVESSDGIRWAYRDGENVIGDMSAWLFFEGLLQ